MTVKSAIAVVS